MNRERIVKTVASLVILITLSVFTSYANSTRENHQDRVAKGSSTTSVDTEVNEPVTKIS